MTDWTNRFLGIAAVVASWSKDTSSSNGAVIVDADNRIISVGYNGQPTGAKDNVSYRNNRPQKYLYFEHAERNAIYNAARVGVSVKECAIYLHWFPCADCARAIIQSGIKKIICGTPDLKCTRWGQHFQVALELLNECGVIIEYYDQ